jgi:phosphatidylserine/phosphatidylglycerophosphate/cardiolipin synthase-like enzyme
MSRSRRHRRAAALLVAAALVLLSAFAGCRANSDEATLPTAVVPASANNQLLVEPDQGMEPVYALLRAPRQSLDLTMYELVDEQAEQILIDDAARGVRVRVILDQRLVRTKNQNAYDRLRSHGVEVVWADRRFAASHQKSLVIDGSVAAILSLNLTSRYYPNTRDFGVVTSNPADVAVITKVFEADFTGRSVSSSRGDDLLWSPGAENALVALVDSARTTILVETEVLSDRPVLDALARAAGRGVRVSLVMTYQKDWAAGFTSLTKAGVAVTYYRGERPIYIHAKTFVVDAGLPGARAYLGSQNLSAASLLRNRELGIVLTEPAMVSSVAGVVSKDAAGGTRWIS